jgi:hypothetical protein
MKENGAWLFENNHFGGNGLTMALTPTGYADVIFQMDFKSECKKEFRKQSIKKVDRINRIYRIKKKLNLIKSC